MNCPHCNKEIPSSELAKHLGKLSGKNLTPKQRIDKARKAGNVRWEKVAFAKAIEDGRLSDNPNRPSYHENYLYTGKVKGVDMFKNKESRNYLKV